MPKLAQNTTFCLEHLSEVNKGVIFRELRCLRYQSRHTTAKVVTNCLIANAGSLSFFRIVILVCFIIV